MQNNFDTPPIIKLLDDLMIFTNKYFTQQAEIKLPLIEKVTNYIKFIYKCFGINFESSQ